MSAGAGVLCGNRLDAAPDESAEGPPLVRRDSTACGRDAGALILGTAGFNFATDGIIFARRMTERISVCKLTTGVETRAPAGN